jgi:hypothetical protein
MLLSEILITLFALIAIMIAGGVFAVLYLVIYSFSTVFRGVFRFCKPSVFAPPGAHVCPRGLCRAVNPPQARFCKRCGMEMSRATVVGRRVYTG